MTDPYSKTLTGWAASRAAVPGDLQISGPWVRPVRVIYLMAVDFGALFLCGALAYMAWAMPVHNQPAELYLNLVPLLGFFVFGYSVFGLYPGFGLGGPEVLRRLTLVTLFCFVFVAAVTFVLKLPHLYSRMTFVLALSASLLLLPVARYAALLPVRRRRWWKKPVVLIADPQDAAEAVAALSRSEESGYRVVGILNLGRTGAGPGVGGVPSIGSLDDAGEIAALGISTAVVVAEGAPATDTLDRLRLHFRHVVMIKSYTEVAIERLQVRDLGGALSLEYENNLLVTRNRIAKRCLDLVGGLVGLVVTAPLLVVSLLVTRLGSPGPVLYFQTRRGLKGRRIRVPKVRTMFVDAEALLEEQLETDPKLRRDWEANFKLKRDPRIVPFIGPVLRRWSLDELPQLVSVVKGEMSLVGPRPLPDYHLQSLSSRAQELRAEVRPGLTGLWQVSGRSHGDLAEQEASDEYYIRNWTIWLDLYVLGRTAGAVISGRGAY